MSAEALPTWAGLIDQFSSELGAVPDGSSYLDIAQFYDDQYGRTALHQKLKEHLSTADVQMLDVHRILLSLPMTHIFTTNFDTLLEQASAQQKRKVNKIVADHDVPTFAGGSRNSVDVVKVHGCLENVNTIVFTAKDYEEFFRERPAMRRLTEFVLQTRTVLFVGYSFNDPDLRMMLGRVFAETGRFSLPSYIVMFDPPPALTTSLQKRNLQVVALKTSGRSKSAVMGKWLDELAKRIKFAQVSNSGQAFSQAEPNHNLPAPSFTKFVARKEQAQILSAIRYNHLTIVEGLPGTGKSSLVQKIARELAAGQHGAEYKYAIWIAIEGRSDSAEWIDAALSIIARTMKYPLVGQISLSNLQQKKNEVAQLLRANKSLLIIDGFQSGVQESVTEWLETIGKDTRTLIVTRPNPHLRFSPDLVVSIVGLSASEALELIRE